MHNVAGFKIVRVAELEWEYRNRFGGKCKNRARTYIRDEVNGLAMRLVDFPAGSVEPRHVHPGTHVATVLKGRAIVDGVPLNQLDVILGPGNEPHGPLHYPDGCQLLSAFQGSNEHAEAQKLSAKRRYRLIQASNIPWQEKGVDGQVKTLVEDGAGRLLVRALRLAPGTIVPRHSHPYMQAALIIEGTAVVENETLGVWDLLYQPRDVEHGPASFPEGATLLAFTMRLGDYALD